MITFVNSMKVWGISGRSTNEEGRGREPKPSEEAEEVAEERERHRDEERECCYRDACQIRTIEAKVSFRGCMSRAVLTDVS
jgi:hypothetical protein